MPSITEKTLTHIQTGLIFAGAAASLGLFIYLLKAQVYGPVALLACGACMIGVCAVALGLKQPPKGPIRQIAWGGLGFFAMGIAVAAVVMHREVSGQ